ncbi:hypothetical protein [Shimia marina]|nr:hypothetical protein [Shimia marina]
MIQITRAPALDARYKVFAGCMEAEYGYYGVSHGQFLDTRPVRAIHNNHRSKRKGLPDEWYIYQLEDYALDDYGMLMGPLTTKPIRQSNFYRLLDEDELPSNFAKAVGEVRNFVSSGVVFSAEDHWHSRDFRPFFRSLTSRHMRPALDASEL